MKKRLIIAIDGPAGSGKSTVAKEVARRLGILYADTGAMYRALTLKAMREKIDFKNKNMLIELVGRIDIVLKTNDDFALSVLLDGEDVTDEIRKNSVTNNIKHIAHIPEVRKQMVALQRKIASSGRAVLEGRDIGTIVFPDANRKIYLDANSGERAKRRHKELKEKGHDITIEEIEKDVEERDYTDKNRAAGPLKKADDAIVIDTTNLTIAEVVERIIKEL